MDKEYMLDEETVTADDWEEACEVEQYDLQELEYYLDNEDNQND